MSDVASSELCLFICSGISGIDQILFTVVSMHF